MGTTDHAVGEPRGQEVQHAVGQAGVRVAGPRGPLAGVRAMRFRCRGPRAALPPLQGVVACRGGALHTFCRTTPRGNAPTAAASTVAPTWGVTTMSRIERAPAADQIPWPRTMAGAWVNELGSWMGLQPGPDGTLTGTYTSGVGATRCPQQLQGRFGPPDASGSAVLAFVVAWPNGSVASWLGRYERQLDRIVTTWLLESASACTTAWRTTQIGHDEFTHASKTMSSHRNRCPT